MPNTKTSTALGFQVSCDCLPKQALTDGVSTSDQSPGDSHVAEEVVKATERLPEQALVPSGMHLVPILFSFLPMLARFPPGDEKSPIH